MVEERVEVIFEPDDKPVDLCLVCQQADLGQVQRLVPHIPSDVPALLITDPLVYNGRGEPPTKSKRGMNETVPLVYEDREDQLAQLWLEHHFRLSPQPRIILRVFDVYGPGVATGVIPEWIDKALNHEEIEVNEFLEVHRTFLYIDDFLDVFQQVRRRLSTVKFDVFNVGATEMISSSRLAQYVCSMVNGQHSQPKLTYDPGDFEYLAGPSQSWRLPNIRRIQGFTGWSPRVSLRQGLFHTINHQAHYGNRLVLAQTSTA